MMETKITTAQQVATTEKKTRAPRKAQQANKAQQAAKAQQADKAKAETKSAGITITVPGNRPTSGAYLYAYTSACMAIIRRAPKAKQGAIAKLLHGTRAMSHHGPTGTKKIVPQKDGSIAYDTGYFAIGAKSTDKKRQAIPETWADAFSEYILSGKLTKAPDGFAWKPIAKPLAVITVGVK